MYLRLYAEVNMTITEDICNMKCCQMKKLLIFCSTIFFLKRYAETCTKRMLMGTPRSLCFSEFFFSIFLFFFFSNLIKICKHLGKFVTWKESKLLF